MLTTIATISTFGGAITSEKEEGTLQLVMMTGISSLSYLSGRASGKLFQILFIFILLIPASLFGATLGGVTIEQILSAYLILGFWLFFVGSISLWTSVMFSRKREAFIIAAVITGLIFLIEVFCGVNPVHRMQDILTLGTLYKTYPMDMSLYFALECYSFTAR